MKWFTKLRERARERRAIEQARRDGHVRGLQFLRAKLRMELLDSRLASAMTRGDQQGAEEIMPELRIALSEYQKLLVEEAAENQRISVFLSSVKESE
jgi:hypothetical protein